MLSAPASLVAPAAAAAASTPQQQSALMAWHLMQKLKQHHGHASPAINAPQEQSGTKRETAETPTSHLPRARPMQTEHRCL